MKLSAKLLLITFLIIVVVSVSYSIIYFSLTDRILKSQQINASKISLGGILFSAQTLSEELTDDFNSLIKNNNKEKFYETSLDFLFLSDKNRILKHKSYFKSEFKFLGKINSTEDFENNQNSVLYKTGKINNRTYYYGVVLNKNTAQKFMANLQGASDINIVLLKNNLPLLFSNEDLSNQLYNEIVSTAKTLRSDEVEIFSKESDEYFYAGIYKELSGLFNNKNLGIVIFSASSEIVQFKATMRWIIMIMVIAIIFLTVIIVLISTTKLRKQISQLNYAAELVGKGDFNYKIKVLTTDEIGRLGYTFNHMIDELKGKSDFEKNIMSFVSFMNTNPTSKQIAEKALKKIIKQTAICSGAIYLINENSEIELIAKTDFTIDDIDGKYDKLFFKNLIETKEKKEYCFTENFPVIKTGVTEIKIGYLLFIPIFYDNNIIGVMELAAGSKSDIYNYKFIEAIQEQLSVGLTNSRAFEQLEILVQRLKKLNDDYRIQNENISKKNEELIALHTELKTKAEELGKEKERAENLAQAKSHFLASMSHELRTPLNSILGLTELTIKNKSTTQSTKEKLNIVLRNGKRLLILINNILEYSKLDSEKVKVKTKEFSLNNLIEEVESYIYPLVLEKQLKFKILWSHKSSVILNTSDEMLEQLLLNILGNAVKFTNRGEIKLEINISDKDLEFIISDTGIGISEKDQKIIFNEFKQINEGANGGAGLGLAICKKYLDLLGGSITVESKVGVGSKFIINFPNIIVSLAKLLEQPTISNNSDLALIYSNNENFINLKLNYLKSKGIKSIIIRSEELLQKLLYHNPFVIIFDFSMPNVFEIILQIKSNNNTLEIPTIVFNSDFEIHKAYALFPTQYLPIPNSFDELQEKLSHFDLHSKTICIISERLNRDLFNNNLNKFNVDYLKVEEFFKIKNPNYEIILIDLFGSEIDGLKIVSKIRKNRIAENKNIILMFDEFMLNEYKNEIFESFDLLKKTAGYSPIDTLNVLRKQLSFELNDNISNLMFESDEPTERNGDMSEKVVLIVDDDKDTLYTVGEIVKEIGCDVLYASNGKECLKVLKTTNKIDLVLLDIMMPVMDGFETIKNIRKSKELEQLTVIALTAYAMLDNKEIIEKNGFTDIITKPIIATNILQRVEEYLGGRK